MMNKRRTKEIGRTKYIMFLPLAALLMIVSNIEVVARTTERFAKEVMEQVNTPQPEIANIPNCKVKKFSKQSLCRPKKKSQSQHLSLKARVYPILWYLKL